MINLSSINPMMLPFVPLEDRSALPLDPCIYFAIDSQGTIQYIGRSVNPRQRWQYHHRHDDLVQMTGVRIAYLNLDADLLPVVEKALIEWFNPPLNCDMAEVHARAMKTRALRILSKEEVAIATAVWEGQIDGWTTRMVADAFGVTTNKALRILKNICKGRCDLHPFVHDEYYNGVKVADGRIFVWGENADYLEGHGRRHHNWFYM
jgi:hypothetical protein